MYEIYKHRRNKNKTSGTQYTLLNEDVEGEIAKYLAHDDGQREDAIVGLGKTARRHSSRRGKRNRTKKGGKKRCSRKNKAK